MISEKGKESSVRPANRYEDVPLYIQVEDSIQEMISRRELEVGDSIPGRNILSGEFGVSDLTVRKAIGHLVRRGVLISRQGRGTFVASSPKFRKICFVCGMDAFDSDVSSYFTHFMGVCNRKAIRLGLVLEPIFLSDRCPEDSLLYCNTDHSRGYEGYIFLGCKLAHPLLNYVKNNRLNYVVVTHRESGVKRVTLDFRAGVIKAVEYFLGSGNKDITIVCNSDTIDKVEKSTKSFDGAVNIIELKSLSRATDCEIGGYRLIQDILSKGEVPSTMFFLDNIVARGASRAILRAGLHFENNIDWVIFSGLTEIIPLGFPVSYIVSDTEKQAEEAVGILTNQIDGKYGHPDHYHEIPYLLLRDEIQEKTFGSVAMCKV